MDFLPTSKVRCSTPDKRGRTIAGELFRDGEAPRGFGSSFGNILKLTFELKNMVCHVFGRKRSEATHGRRPQEQEPRKLSGSRILNGGHRCGSVGRRPFKPQTVLLSRRTYVGSEWI